MKHPVSREKARRDSAAQQYAQQVDAKVQRTLAARRLRTPGLWAGLGSMGLIGWSVVLPTLLGTALGSWLDRTWPGERSWTLALLVAGLMLGCFNAWRWLDREQRAMPPPPPAPEPHDD